MYSSMLRGVLCAFICVGSGVTQAGFGDWLEVLKPGAEGGSPYSVAGGSAVSGEEMTVALVAYLQRLGTDITKTEGLKQALDKGVGHAVSTLGRPGGFLDDSRVRIPMPDKLAWAEKTLRRLGQDRLADDFVQSMNRAAEQAVPEVASVFGEAIRDMSLEDARAILSGPDDAATRYFRQSSSAALTERMLPIVKQATGATGVTSHYKDMTARVGGFSNLLGQDAMDLDGYVTDRALDGLFLMIAEQEKQIRQDPLQRSTALLKKVFGSMD